LEPILVCIHGSWWYLNGEATLVSTDGEKKDIGFFVVSTHQESPIDLFSYA
jgi:hypothetical protein